jgi:hypothetical protein
VVLLLVACTVKQPARPQPPSEGAHVAEGSLVEPYAGISLDVLLPAGADIPAAVARARSEVEAVGFQIVDKIPDVAPKPIATVELANFSDLGWSGRKPGYVEGWTEGRDPQSVFSTVGIVRLKMRGPSERAVDLLTRLSKACHAVAAAYDAWIFDSYRAQLYRPTSFADWMPDPEKVETFVRIVGVTSKTKPSHVRTMGFARLGLPELYIPDVIPESDLDDARFLMRAAAQTYMKRRGVTRRGRFEIDMRTLTRDWEVPNNGSGKFEFEARWIRGPIRDKLIIELSLPGGSRDPTAFAAALHRFVVEAPDAWFP